MSFSLLSYNDFINNEILESDDLKSLYRNVTDEYAAVNEIQQFSNSSFAEYQRVKPYIKRGKISNEISHKLFEYEYEYICDLLTKDEAYVNYTIDNLINKLSSVNESKTSAKNRIKLLTEYKNNTLALIENEKIKAKALYSSNPKILYFK